MDDSFNDGNALGIASRVSSGSNQVNLQSGQSSSSTQVGDLYILSSSSGATLAWLTGKPSSTRLAFATGDPLDINRSGSTNGALSSISFPASAYKVTWVTYLVDANGTLIRKEYGNPSARAGVGVTTTGTNSLEMPLAQGVENMQIEYVMSDGTVDEDPAPTLYQNIRQVRLTLVVRSPELDAQGNPISVTLSSTYSTRNLGYEER
jgi:hypothetical protein